jgi:hypothetical protein
MIAFGTSGLDVAFIMVALDMKFLMNNGLRGK